VEWREDYGTVTLSCDVFSVGIVFWEILTGSYPSEAHVRDTQTNQKIKPTDLASTHTKVWLLHLHRRGLLSFP
jgi:hypothetical protein